MIKAKRYDLVKQDGWVCPAGTGVPLITMPNVPKPLHGLPPRVIMGKTTWDHVRKKCYYDAGYKCEVCGCEPPKGQLHAHELYSYDYKAGTGTFERCIAICKQDHDFIHSGRLLTLFKQGNLLYPKEYVLSVVEKGFKLIHDYNCTHRNKKPLRVYSTFLEYLKSPELHDDMVRLLNKYGIMFYQHPDEGADWSDWRLVLGGKEYPTPYADEEAWQKAMQEQSKKDTARMVGNPFNGEGFSLVDAILNSQKKS